MDAQTMLAFVLGFIGGFIFSILLLFAIIRKLMKLSIIKREE